MIETLSKNTLNKVVFLMRNLPSSIWFRLGIVFVAILLAGARPAWSFFQGHRGHRDDIASAIGSIGFLYGSPQVDSTGSRLIYLQTSEKGLAIFATDAASGKRETLHEWPGVSFTDKHDQVSPISPNDKLFAYSYNDNGDGPTGFLAICDASSGAELARLDAPQYMYEMIWLTPEKLVWLGAKGWNRGGPGFHLHVAEKQPDGKWIGWSPGLELTNASSLTAVSDTEIGWVDNAGLHDLDTVSKTIVASFTPNGKRVTECSYSRKTSEFLVTCLEKGNYSLWRLKLHANPPAPDDFIQLKTDRRIQNARWVNDGRGFAYFNQDALVATTDTSDKQPDYVKVLVDDFVTTANGGNVFLAGAVSNEPWAGIWSYNVTNHSLVNIVPDSEKPTSFATRVDPLHCVAHLGAKESLDYYVYRPTHFDRHKSYPLLIGDTPIDAHINQYSARGPSWAVAMANCGAYVVVVNRKEWFRGMENFGRDTMRIYNQLLPDPTIDSGRIYLYGASAETFYASKLVEQNPELWKGVLFLNPTELPDISVIRPDRRLPKILLSAGADEGGMKRFKKFQADACGRGMVVEIHESPHSGHFFVSESSVQERIRAMVNFVFHN